MHAYDILMLVLLLGTTIFGAWKGMAWQLASLASLVLSAAVAVQFGGPLAPLFGESEPWNRFIAMLVLYLGTSLVIWLIFRFVSGVIDRVRLREFDRQIGAIFGLAKGVLLCLVVTFFAVTLSEAARQAVLKSRSGYYTARLIQRADPVIPDEVRGVLGKYIDELDRRLDPEAPPEPRTLDRLATDSALPIGGEPEQGGAADAPDATAEEAAGRVLDAVREAAEQLPRAWREPSGSEQGRS